MSAALPLLGMLVSLILLLAASELMVHELDIAGHRLRVSTVLLGFVVAVGADAPEISTAIVALVAGSNQIGIGVVEGSNAYNLAGLLGLSALLLGPLAFSLRRVTEDGVINAGLTCLAVLLVFMAGQHSFIALAMLALFLLYLGRLTRHADPASGSGSAGRPLLLAGVATAIVVAMSWLLVQNAILVIHRLHIAEAVLALFVLPIATSLPNTWAAISLARRGMGDALVVTAFSSNSINLVFGLAAPSLVLQLHATRTERLLDGPYLLAMTVVVLLLMHSTNRLSRREGAMVVVLYFLFIATRVFSIG